MEGKVVLEYPFWLMASRPMAVKGAKPGTKQKKKACGLKGTNSSGAAPMDTFL